MRASSMAAFEPGYGIAVPYGRDNVTPYTGLSWAQGEILFGARMST